MMQPTSSASTDHIDANSVQLTVHMLKKKAQVTVEIRVNSTVQDLRAAAAVKLKLSSPDYLMLIFNNEQLADHQDINQLGLTSDSFIIGKRCFHRGESMGKFEIDPTSLDPKYDYDLTRETKPLVGQTFMRGQYQYERPYGWMRTALKVVDEYEDNTWLGPDGIRSETATGEWPVSYHGTSKRNLRGIVQDGFKIGPRDRFGPAIYSSPSLENVAKYYASTFTYQGKSYSLALQNRVNPEHLIVYKPDVTGLPGFPYWLSTQQDPDHGGYHVRPYGILTREVRVTPGSSLIDYVMSLF
ncbi:uncharacterized protein [Asterias amurensis]|uniref:uncharacterized protein n=1 Tax=Asterias amurensis TaxID=7602 RepID=UPI003AB4AEC0